MSARTGHGIEQLCAVARSLLLRSPEVSILRIPLEEAAMVERAIGLPHRVAQRYRGQSLELAVRARADRLEETGLDIYRISEWDAAGSG